MFTIWTQQLEVELPFSWENTNWNLEGNFNKLQV